VTNKQTVFIVAVIRGKRIPLVWQVPLSSEGMSKGAIVGADGIAVRLHG
jgi:hypothetical protein